MRLEAELGLKAGARFAELLRTPGLVVEGSGAIDDYARPLVWLRLPDGTTVGEIMVREGYAREWRPGRRNDLVQVQLRATPPGRAWRLVDQGRSQPCALYIPEI